MSDAAVTWRAIAEADLEAMLDLQVAAAAADRWEETPTADRLRWELEHDLVDWERDSLICIDAAGTALAAGWISANRGGERKHRAIVSPAVRPGHRGGVGVEWLQRIELRCREVLLAHDDDLPLLIRSWGAADATDIRAMHEAAGYRVARWFTTLRRDLAEPIPEPGPVRVIPFTPDRSEGMRLAHNAAFADHWGSEPWTAERWEKGIIGDPGFRPDLSFLVVEGDVVIGYAINEAYPDDFARLGFSEAWVGALGVRPGRRRRGVARALLVHSMIAFRDAGFDRATLGVDSENPTGALGLYESVGFGPQRRWITYLRDVARP